MTRDDDDDDDNDETAVEKFTYTDAGTNAPSKDVDQVCLTRVGDDDVDDETAFEKLTKWTKCTLERCKPGFDNAIIMMTMITVI